MQKYTLAIHYMVSTYRMYYNKTTLKFISYWLLLLFKTYETHILCLKYKCCVLSNSGLTNATSTLWFSKVPQKWSSCPAVFIQFKQLVGPQSVTDKQHKSLGRSINRAHVWRHAVYKWRREIDVQNWVQKYKVNTKTDDNQLPVFHCTL